ncbi:MAG TPA: putative peptide modification system cyclase [Dokdonella sp.]|uniref:putative peptide modification system cyclase n=1 Tax=Dokdonella sp. TaxID=2291710 RepID=UPI002D80C881|nr:putative peptide modification system cyclase [Dokdonella sp.]HET9031395.1 putative peptide modification system cyclase [Dokdonella sp.]
MTALNAPVSTPDSVASSLLRTLLLCDLVDSTGLVERMGDLAAAELIRKHDRLARTLAERHHGREIDKTDGFMMMFDRPVQAVAYALDYLRGLKQLNAAEKANLSARVGIHVGDVVVWDNNAEDIAKGAKPVEVEGLVKPVTSRLMNLALPGQILLSNIAYSLAHRAQGELGPQFADIRWRTHGRYRFRGVPEPVAVFEVGEEGLAPLKAPPWSSKAHREVPFWRRPATVVIEALVVIALVAIPALMFLKPDPAIAFASRDWVVVGSLHNLTGETVFDDALESALRIGLEQSRYVNVLPDLKVRDTITRMQRDPDETEVDRQVGSEVAIRDGARALILPTIAEIGGRVRITAEVIDPHTQTTVYSETADGIGKESILPSLDTINERLRVRLGEALATVSTESKPLEKVTTKNLDALKAFSLCTAENGRGRFPEAIALCQQALGIDPDFASANIRLGVMYFSTGKSIEATNALKLALAKRERLTTRDALFAEVMLATVESKSDVLPRWKALAAAYPDFFAGTGGYAYVAWRDANRFDKSVLEAAQASAAPQNPNRTPALHLLGILNLGNEQFAEAFENFADAEAAGIARTEYHAATEAAKRGFKAAEATLSKSADANATDNPAVSSIRKMLSASFLVDQGRFESAQTLLANAARQASGAASLAHIYEIATFGLQAELESSDKRTADELKALLATSRQQQGDAAGARPMVDSGIAMIAFLAARQGDTSLARTALSQLRADAYPDYSVIRKLQAVAQAEVDRSQGNSKLATTKLTSLLDGSELFLTHAALLDAYADQKQFDKAIGEAQWLAQHRGRAYAESSQGHLLMVINVKFTTLAFLRGAELAAESHKFAEANAMMKSFLEAWPDARTHPALKLRLSRLQAVLSEPSSP